MGSRHRQGCDIVRLEKNHGVTGDAREATPSNIMVDGKSSRPSFPSVAGMLGYASDTEETAACINA